MKLLNMIGVFALHFEMIFQFNFLHALVRILLYYMYACLITLGFDLFSIEYLEYLTMAWVQVFFYKLNNVKYEYGMVIFLDYVKSIYFNRDLFKAFVWVCRNFGPLNFHIRIQKGSLGNALRRLHSESVVKRC